MAVLPPSPETGEALFVSSLEVIERVTSFVASRHRLSAQDADDFSSHVHVKLIEDDYAILRKFGGRSSLRTFLAVVIQRLFYDYRNSAWGKWRPSAEARRSGAVGVLLEQLTVRDGFAFDEACELLRTNHRVTASRAELEAMAGRFPVRPRRRFESDEVLENMPDAGDRAGDPATGRERLETAASLGAGLKSVLSGLERQDRLILLMRFEDGRTVAEIAKILHLDQKPLYRRLEGLLSELRDLLQARGFDRAVVMEMLESRDVSVEWGGDAGETGTAGPSTGKGAGWR